MMFPAWIKPLLLVRSDLFISLVCMTALHCSCTPKEGSERELVMQGRVPSMAGELSRSGRMRRATC